MGWIDWSKVDLKRPTRDLMAELGCTQQAISLARKRLGVQPAKIRRVSKSLGVRVDEATYARLMELVPEGQLSAWIADAIRQKLAAI